MINTGTTIGIITNTFTTDVKIKSFSAILLIFCEKLLIGNEFLIFLMYLLYFIDFILGLIISFKDKQFELGKFFRGAFKILVYGTFLVIGISLDEILPYTLITPTIFGFVIISDSISILRKFDYLGFETPMFLEKYLLSYKNKIENGRK